MVNSWGIRAALFLGSGFFYLVVWWLLYNFVVMKILLSSKVLATKLKEIDFEKESVERVSLNNGDLIIITQNSSVTINVHVLEFKASIKQGCSRWDWVKQLTNQVDEQPIVLQMFENVVNIIFQY